MSASPCPVMWDFSRTAAQNASGVGGVLHYYDETAQTIYLDGGSTGSGFATNTAEVIEGHWRDTEFGDEIIISPDFHADLGMDHPSTGLVYGSTISGGSVYFWRYLYAMELSSITKSGTLNMDIDNPVTQANVTLMNVENEQLESDAGLYLPGSKLRLGMFIGNSTRIPLATLRVDDISYSVISDTVTLSARNSLGFLLKEQTMGEETAWSGCTSDIVEGILQYAGIARFIVQLSEDAPGFTFEPDDTVMDALTKICEYYNPWTVVELPNGTVLVGYPGWINNWQPTGYSQFSVSEMWKRQTKRVADGAYTAVRATGKTSGGEELEPVTVPVSNWAYWALPVHKIYHIQATDGLSQAGLQAYAEAVAEELQYVGIDENFTVPMRPQLLTGDVCQVYREGEPEAVSLGLVTSITHHFGQSGYYTEFCVDSGGKATDGTSRSVVSVARDLSGHNRKQTMADLIGIVAKNRK